jgi:hypothetical protein
MRGLSTAPSARYPSMTELLDELDQNARRLWGGWSAIASAAALAVALVIFLAPPASSTPTSDRSPTARRPEEPRLRTGRARRAAPRLAAGPASTRAGHRDHQRRDAAPRDPLRPPRGDRHRRRRPAAESSTRRRSAAVACACKRRCAPSHGRLEGPAVGPHRADRRQRRTPRAVKIDAPNGRPASSPSTSAPTSPASASASACPARARSGSTPWSSTVSRRAGRGPPSAVRSMRS